MNIQQTWRILCRGLAPAATLVALAGCGGGGSSGGGADGTATALEAATGRADATALAQSASADGRLLASNCFQCHGTMGTGGFEEIRGKSAAELKEFLSKPAGRNIMAAHAQGYTPAQLDKIAAYLQR